MQLIYEKDEIIRYFCDTVRYEDMCFFSIYLLYHCLFFAFICMRRNVSEFESKLITGRDTLHLTVGLQSLIFIFFSMKNYAYCVYEYIIMNVNSQHI